MYIYIYIYIYMRFVLINILVSQLGPLKQKFLAPLLNIANPKPSQAKSSPTTRSSKPTNEPEKTIRSRSKPTNPHPQSTKKPEEEGKKNNKKKSERDQRLRLEQDRRLVAPPPPRDGCRSILAFESLPLTPFALEGIRHDRCFCDRSLFSCE